MLTKLVPAEGHLLVHNLLAVVSQSIDKKQVLVSLLIVFKVLKVFKFVLMFMCTCENRCL